MWVMLMHNKYETTHMDRVYTPVCNMMASGRVQL